MEDYIEEVIYVQYFAGLSVLPMIDSAHGRYSILVIGEFPDVAYKHAPRHFTYIMRKPWSSFETGWLSMLQILFSILSIVLYFMQKYLFNT